MATILYLSGSTQEHNLGVGSYGSEEKRMQELADLIQHYISIWKGPIKVYRNNGRMTLEQTVADSNSKKANLHLALHSNAGAGGKGTECYYYYASKSGGKAWAKCIYDAVAPLTISSDRGVKPDNILYKHGLYETRSTNATACLIEIMFHDNKVDVTDYLGKVDQIAQAIAKAIYSYLKLNYSTNKKNYEAILREVTLWYDIYLKDIKNMENLNHNWPGLIEKLYYTQPK